MCIRDSLLQGGIVVLSVRLLWAAYDNTDDIFGEVSQALQKFKSRFRTLELILGVDSNTTLPKELEDVTGSTICEPMKSHSWNCRYKIAECLRVLNIIE